MASAKTFIAGLIGGAALMCALAAPAGAIDDPVVSAARAANKVGEQADGYLGTVPGADVSADLAARVEQINIGRRAYYTQQATQNNASVNEMASAVACRLFAEKIEMGESYRDETGTWRTRTAGAPVARPSFCTQQ